MGLQSAGERKEDRIDKRKERKRGLQSAGESQEQGRSSRAKLGMDRFLETNLFDLPHECAPLILFYGL